MPVKENVDAFTEVDEGNALSVANDIITATTFSTLADTGYFVDDKGVDVIADGWSYDTYFNLSLFTVGASLVPLQTANAVGDLFDVFLANIDSAAVMHFSTSGLPITLFIIHGYGASQQELSTTGPAYTFIQDNDYRQNVTRSGQSIIFTLYDEEGGHGTPGAAIFTDTLACAQPLLDHRYLNAIVSNDQNTAGKTISGTIGPLWDMIASAGGFGGSYLVNLKGFVW